MLASRTLYTQKTHSILEYINMRASVAHSSREKCVPSFHNIAVADTILMQNCRSFN